MNKRLAVTISGAVSLGSYEAGVMFEILDAIKQHNQHADTRAAGDFIKIDVLTGASAGGMTATILAQKLLFEAGSLYAPYANSLYLPWVVDVNLNGLLQMHGNDSPDKSILSSQLISDISERYLTARYGAHMDFKPDPHPAADTKILLGLALANLNGVDYGISLKPQGQFCYTKHQDQLTIELDGSQPQDYDTLAQWEPLRQAALSCGAFPFAFRLVDLFRGDADYASMPPRITPILPGQQFTYTDGGTFQNEPLGLAKNLVDQIDHHQNADSRFYLYVSPGTKDPKGVSQDKFNSKRAGYVEIAGRMLCSIFEQARFQDWIETDRINQKIDRFNAIGTALCANMMTAGGLAANQLSAVTTILLPLLNVNLAAERARLQGQFAVEFNQLTNSPAGPPAANQFIDALLVLETVAQIGHYDEMTTYAITASDSELASSELAAFAGFFDLAYRDHDYDVGRQKAQAFLTDPAISTPGGIGPIRYTPKPNRHIDPQLNGLKLNKMDRATREKVRDRLRDRLLEVIKKAGVEGFIIGPIAREALDLGLITPQLNKILKL